MKWLRNKEEKTIWRELEMLKAKLDALETKYYSLRGQINRLNGAKDQDFLDDPNAKLFGIGNETYKNTDTPLDL